MDRQGQVTEVEQGVFIDVEAIILRINMNANSYPTFHLNLFFAFIDFQSLSLAILVYRTPM